MPGTVVRTIARPGDTVSAGDPVIVLEAMKMEMDVGAPVDGTVIEIAVNQGAHVTTGQVLALIRKES